MRHVSAFLVFFIFGLLPLIVYFTILDAPFQAKPVTCGDAAQVQEETPGIEGLFTVDRTAGRFPFWLAKLLDTIWDLVVARGMQVLAGWISYVVFCNAMLRALEESPIPYRTFTGLAMNGASLWTVGCVVRDLGRHGRKRTVLLFAYAAVALVYVLAMPTLFSTMTGYISVSSAFTKVPGTSQFVPTDEFVPGYTYSGLPDVPDGTCVSRELVAPADYRFDSRNAICNSTCVTNFPNGTRKDLATGELLSPYDARTSTLLAQQPDDCTYSPNETYTGLSAPMALLYTDPGSLRAIRDLYNPDNIAYNCAAPITLTLTNTTLPYATALAHLVPDSSYCYNGHGYDATAVRLAGRCLPDTGGGGGGGDGDGDGADGDGADGGAGSSNGNGGNGGGTYQWGFSAMLTSVVLVVHGARFEEM
ncbi:hypothetical protein UCDDS831_g01493 [Diplodia seriata]|uniref:Uncharacterized protein n=1 Tax=Diplodia seriata TaxID=420778 RepID=A0A0G2GSZ9_9PEZI|nr:hypothetical protein UCDDS831_g01493 [Diplodia seriata]